MKLLCVWLLTIFSGTASANEALRQMVNQQVGQCYFNLLLVGQKRFFWVYGRDSWCGSGILTCRQDSITTNTPIQVRYEGLRPGFASAIDVNLTLESTFPADENANVFGAYRVNAQFPADNTIGELILQADKDDKTLFINMKSSRSLFSELKTFKNLGQLQINYEQQACEE